MKNTILDVKIDIGLSKNEILVSIHDRIKKRIPGYICTTNAEFIVDALKDIEFKEIINKSMLSIPDGAGVILANSYLNGLNSLNTNSKILKILSGLKIGYLGFTNMSNLGERIAGIDLMIEMCALAEREHLNVFILGGWPKDKKGKPLDTNRDLATEAATSLKQKFPKLTIVGATSKFSYKPTDDNSTLDYIHSCMLKNKIDTIDMIFVAYNHINQEKWLARNMSKIPATIGMGVGGSLDFITGTQQRAPLFMQKMCIEWLYRLLREPWRYKRIFKAFPYFPYLVLLRALRTPKTY